MAFFRKKEILGKAAAGAMGRTAGAVGGVSDAAVKFSENLSKIKRAQWEAGRDMFGNMALIDFDKGSQFMRSFTDFFKQLGIWGKIINGFMVLFKMFDAALIQEYTEEIQQMNKALANKESMETMRQISKWVRVMEQSTPTFANNLRQWEDFWRILQQINKDMDYMKSNFELGNMAIRATTEALDDFIEKIKDLMEATGQRPGGRSEQRSPYDPLNLKKILEG